MENADAKEMQLTAAIQCTAKRSRTYHGEIKVVHMCKGSENLAFTCQVKKILKTKLLKKKSKVPDTNMMVGRLQEVSGTGTGYGGMDL